MFGNLIDLAKSAADLADAAVGALTEPVKQGADFITEGLRDVIDAHREGLDDDAQAPLR